MKYDHGIHHRRSIRLKGYGYSQNGAYFVTVCTHNRECLLGEITDGEMVTNEYGKIVDKCWRDLPNHYPNIQLDYFVVMPNHFHGIVMINIAGAGVGANAVGAGFKPAPTTTNHGLSEFIRALKTFSSEQINQIRNTPGISAWQRNYYEHIIRNEDDLNRIREYIRNNPTQWDEDENNLLRKVKRYEQ